ncbi:MAG: hypothetical protein LQ352_004373 [Teloschistes flavicans]|nr:MAG: hypothetical protein LQ352_004373 [Teloschistes flavicans]
MSIRDLIATSEATRWAPRHLVQNSQHPPPPLSKSPSTSLGKNSPGAPALNPQELQIFWAGSMAPQQHPDLRLREAMAYQAWLQGRQQHADIEMNQIGFHYHRRSDSNPGPVEPPTPTTSASPAFQPPPPPVQQNAPSYAAVVRNSTTTTQQTHTLAGPAAQQTGNTREAATARPHPWRAGPEEKPWFIGKKA